MPYAFNIDGVYLNRAVLEELNVDIDAITAVDSDDILGWYEQARALHPDLQLFFTAQGKDTLFPTERMRYIDLENKTASFDSPKFVDFLSRTRNTINDDPALSENKELGYGDGLLMDESLRYQETGKINPYLLSWPEDMQNYWADMVMKGRESLAVTQELMIYDVVHSTQPPLEYVVGPYPLVSTDGHLSITTQYENFLMPSSLKNKELAWEFIKYCFSEREDLTFDRYGWTSCDEYIDCGITVTKANFSRMAEESPEKVKSGVIFHYVLHNFGSVDGEEVTETMERILSLTPIDRGKYNLDLKDYLDEFYSNELTTPEQCAEKIQGRTEIWLNE